MSITTRPVYTATHLPHYHHGAGYNPRVVRTVVCYWTKPQKYSLEPTRLDLYHPFDIDRFVLIPGNSPCLAVPHHGVRIINISNLSREEGCSEVVVDSDNSSSSNSNHSKIPVSHLSTRHTYNFREEGKGIKLTSSRVRRWWWIWTTAGCYGRRIVWRWKYRSDLDFWRWW